MNTKSTIFLLIGLQNLAFGSESEWGYGEDNGPSTWDGLCMDGTSQSPIDIPTNDAEVNTALGTFTRNLFDALPTGMTLANTGHSIQVNLVGGYTILERALLPADFKAAQFHIHWAKAGEKGSEHVLNGKQYFGELHIVHYNTKYDSLSTAADKSDGLAVLGFFIEDSYLQNNLQFDALLGPFNSSNQFFGGSEQTIVSPFSIETLLPPNIDTYYRYKGSLTTPACYESVIWTVFETPIRISRAQAAVLETQIYSEAGSLLNGNYRPPQNLNGRSIQTPPECKRGNNAPVVRLSIATLLSVFLLTLIFQQH